MIAQAQSALYYLFYLLIQTEKSEIYDIYIFAIIIYGYFIGYVFVCN